MSGKPSRDKGQRMSKPFLTFVAPGIPVATVGIDNSRNAALLAAAILALQDDDVRRALEKYRRQWDQ